MNLTVIVQPPFEPVTLVEVYKQLRLDPDVQGSPAEYSHPDDSMLQSQIQTAREFVEVESRRALVQRTLRLSCPAAAACFGIRWRGTAGPIRLIRPPLVRVEQVQFYDIGNVLRTVDTADYYVTDDLVPELHFQNGFNVSGIAADRKDAVRVEYVAGYAPAGSPPTTQEEWTASIPQTLKQAVLIGVQLQYDNLSKDDRDAMVRMRTAMVRTLQIPLTP